jgi:hypothetical protein
MATDRAALRCIDFIMTCFVVVQDNHYKAILLQIQQNEISGTYSSLHYLELRFDKGFMR